MCSLVTGFQTCALPIWQGSLAVEARADAGADLLALLATLDDLDTRVAVTAERAVLSGLDAGCSAPVGAHAEVVSGDLRVRARSDERRAGKEGVRTCRSRW